MAIITQSERDNLRTTETMKYFHIGHGTLKQWMAKGAPYHIIGSTRWFSISELTEWMKGN